MNISRHNLSRLLFFNQNMNVSRGNLKKIAVMSVLALTLFSNCRTSSYITDEESRARQKVIRRYRTGINFSDAMVQIGSAVTTAMAGVNISSLAATRSFKKLKLKNESRDTMFVNMVTDFLWRDSTYCDIREIIIPPSKSAKLIAPLGATYNVYYRRVFDAPEDEKIEINTANERIIRLGGDTSKDN